jgi:cell division protein FtsI (penicillin-binding protein 3)
MPANPALHGSTRRIYLMAGILSLWVLAIAVRLVDLQIVRYPDFLRRAARQQQRTIEVTPSRGVIYDRNGRELAMSVMADSIFAVPSEIPDQVTAARLLGRVLNDDPHAILARMQASRNFAWIERKVDTATGDRVRALNLKGIYFQKEPKRFYPKKELAAQVIGYVGLDDAGLAGIERGYNDQLQGRPGRRLISMDARRRALGGVERPPEPGQNIVLTLDENIQYIAERELEMAMAETHSLAGTVIVENPNTGEILALANRPTFNPNAGVGKPSELQDRAISDIYEPGSTFKLVTISAALQEGLTRPDEVIDCQEGAIVLAGLRIRDHAAYGDLTVAQILQHSSDVGAIKLGLRLGDDKLYQYIRAYGFGSKTDIELPGETRGLTRPVSRWSKVSIGAISMGQEIGVSPIQLISMVSTIANNGLYTAPRIVAGVAPPHAGRETIVFHPGPQHRVVSQLVAVEMKKMMENVVLEGTGRKAMLDGYTVAGKTGTAQKADPATGAYSKSHYVASFTGFTPVNNPAIAILVVLDSPMGSHEGGQVAAPVFKRIAQQVLAYLHVPEDVDSGQRLRWQKLASAPVRDSDIAEGSTERVESGMPMDDAPAPAGPAPQPAAVRAAAVPAQSFSPLLSPQITPVARDGTVVLDVSGGQVVPSFLGKPLREALVLAQQSGIEIDAIGSGVAREQSPPPGAHIPSGARVAVRFAP